MEVNSLEEGESEAIITGSSVRKSFEEDYLVLPWLQVARNVQVGDQQLYSGRSLRPNKISAKTGSPFPQNSMPPSPFTA